MAYPPAAWLPARRKCCRMLSPAAGLWLLKADTQTWMLRAADGCRERRRAEDDGERQNGNGVQSLSGTWTFPDDFLADAAPLVTAMRGSRLALVFDLLQ